MIDNSLCKPDKRMFFPVPKEYTLRRVILRGFLYAKRALEDSQKFYGNSQRGRGRS